ncbi:histidine kinase [Arsenicicoccus piscis]|uniref:histidine kinase n=1 Tax=Arsenicicoccus piscis TaxID=673954 RepID=A0ABQ6HKK3_9MICO|nr:histidine kinase [Arsenicicoccus piscis]MCH8628361.1 histidine kinase [Arsenicicoccus piscis]GMA18635.1 histidine kinase [Arsenicicoccus piscis]
MSRRLLGPVAQVFLGAALALPPTLLGWAFWTAARTDGSPLTLLTLLGLAVLAVAVVALVALAPAVRPVEVAAARSLLGVDLPDPLVPEARESRLLGAAWVGVCALVGGAVLFLLLLLVPIGFGLLAYPFGSTDQLRLPGTPTCRVAPGWSAAWLVLPGLVSLAAAVATPLVGARLLQRWAPTFLSPTAADRIAEAGRREQDALRRNEIARELHDSLGHALAAISLQAGAGRRVAATGGDPVGQLEAVEELSRSALADLDGVLGLLRGGGPGSGTGADAAHGTDIDAELARIASLHSHLRLTSRLESLAGLPPEVGRAVLRVVQEGLANAGRHGCPPAELVVTRAPDGAVDVHLTNAVPDEAISPRTVARQRGSGSGSGLPGIRARVDTLGGTARWGPIDDGTGWTLSVHLPAAEEGPG